MALNTNRTNVDFSFRHVEQVDKLGQSVGGVVATVQSLLDSRAEDNLTDVNNVKTTMRSTTVGDSGAKNIGASIYADIVGVTVQAQLEEINLKSATAFPVLDGSLGDIKLSNTAGQIKDVVLGHTAQLADVVNLASYGVVDGDNVTIALRDAITKGRTVKFPSGIFFTDLITIPFASRGLTIEGTGFDHYAEKGTIIKPLNIDQASIFKMADGANNITFKSLKIDGDNKALIGIDGTFGSFLTLESIGVYRCLDFGAYLKQGLARINNVFFNNPGVGLHLYSDSSVSNSEFSSGTIPVLIVAGGNRFSNVWVNSASEHCIKLKPFDATTTHINTSFVNCYIGEVSGLDKSIIYAEDDGTNVQKVRQVQFTNSHIVAAAFLEQTCDMIKLVNCDDWVISNIAALGYGSFSSATKLNKSFLNLNACNRINVDNIVCNGLSAHPFVIVGCTVINLGIITLHAIGGTYAVTQQEKSGIYITTTNKFTLGELYVFSDDIGVTAIYGDSGNGHMINHIYVDFPNAATVIYGINTPYYMYNSAVLRPTYNGTFTAKKLSITDNGAANDPAIIFNNGAGIYKFGANGVAISDGSTIKVYLSGTTLFNDLGDFRTTGNGKGFMCKSPDGTITKRLGIDNSGNLVITN